MQIPHVEGDRIRALPEINSRVHPADPDGGYWVISLTWTRPDAVVVSWGVTLRITSDVFEVTGFVEMDDGSERHEVVEQQQAVAHAADAAAVIEEMCHFVASRHEWIHRPIPT